jgi:glucose-1-phosphate cytidylyltransferase
MSFIDAKKSPYLRRPRERRCYKMVKEPTQVVILCGGLGTRLREETEYRPKPLVEIGGLPILWHIMKIYSYYGFNDFILPLGYKGSMIKDYFVNYEWMSHDFTLKTRSRDRIYHYSDVLEDWNITFAHTGAETNTGGRIKKIEKYVRNDVFMATYGDGVADIDIKKLLEYHRSHDCIATLTAVHPMSFYGVLDIDGNDIVQGFKEKPRLEGWINSGFFVFDRKIFEYLGDNDVLEQEPLEKLSSEGQLAVYRHKGFWKSMDTYKDAQLLNKIWEQESPPWRIWK